MLIVIVYASLNAMRRNIRGVPWLTLGFVLFSVRRVSMLRRGAGGGSYGNRSGGSRGARGWVQLLAAASLT